MMCGCESWTSTKQDEERVTSYRDVRSEFPLILMTHNEQQRLLVENLMPDITCEKLERAYFWHKPRKRGRCDGTKAYTSFRTEGKGSVKYVVDYRLDWISRETETGAVSGKRSPMM